MLVIKPYGRSHVEKGAQEQRKRTLHLNTEPKTPQDIPDFAGSHDALILAQWISIIDKIATKPKKGEKPSVKRTALEKAAWKYLKKHNLLSGLQDEEKEQYLHKIWQSKIETHGKNPLSDEGRWYQRFAGEPFDAQDIVKSIHEHLYSAEFRMERSRPNKSRGLIAARGQSISKNVLHRPKEVAALSEDDKKAYKAAGNVALQIVNAHKPHQKVRLSDAARVLYKHYALVFPAQHGKALSIKQAQKDHPGLFALHMNVKDTYTRILKDHRNRQSPPVLPRDMEALFALVEKKRQNRDLNAMVRLGKIIHYETKNWPADDDVSASPFWGSDGQAKIKRNEAFVRIWRHALTLANLTLKDWAGPTPQDILGGRSIKQAVDEDHFKSECYLNKLPLLFGGKASLFETPEEDLQKNILRFALEKTSSLRNATFHFKGHATFIKALKDLAKDINTESEVLGAARKLWDADQQGQTERVRQTLSGAKCHHFFAHTQVSRVFEAVSDPACGATPLPRLRRVLKREDGTRKNLPEPANRTALEDDPSRLCQYTILKLLYERPFRRWLETRTTDKVKAYIDTAIKRTTDAAKNINGKGKDKDLIIARAKNLPRLQPSENIQAFFFALSAATATEMRVQKGYESDPAKAREQAEYIEDLKCDVVGLALYDYLQNEGFGFVLGLHENTSYPASEKFDIKTLKNETPELPTATWQKVLYFLLHLVPVDGVSKLLHQIRKWEILETQPAQKKPQDTAAPLRTVLSLYLDMHDAKFEGGNALIGTDKYKDLFETETGFNTVFPSTNNDHDRHLPRRGLREIMRFGHLPVLLPIFLKHQITGKDVETWCTSDVADHQRTREELHEKWSRKRKEFSNNDCNNYKAALESVTKHRQLCAHVTLTNHARLHRLLMAVLGRLVDYSGLWERDLYLVTLAILHQKGSSPCSAFKKKGLRLFEDGQIVAALRNLQQTSTLKNDLSQFFDDLAPKTRNDFAHFNMLRDPTQTLDLTKCVNNARKLMTHDRKLKNAVSQSIIELLEREGLILKWKMVDHQLTGATLTTKQAHHLVSKKQSNKEPILENLHGDDYVKMVAALFNGTVATP